MDPKLRTILELISELPQGQQELFGGNRLSRIDAACNYAAGVSPEAFESLFSDIVTAGVPLLRSVFEKKNLPLFKHLVGQLKHPQPLLGHMLKLDGSLYIDMLNANAKLKRVRAVVMQLQMALQRTRVLGYRLAVRDFKVAYQRSDLLATFLTVAEFEALEAAADAKALPAESGPVLDSPTRKRAAQDDAESAAAKRARELPSEECVDWIEALDLGERFVKLCEDKWSSQHESATLEWCAGHLRLVGDLLHQYNVRTTAVRKVVAYKDVCAEMFCAVGHLRLAKNKVKPCEINVGDHLPVRRSIVMSRRSQVVLAMTVAGYMSASTPWRSQACLEQIVEVDQPIGPMATKHYLYFAKEVIKRAHSVGRNGLLYIILKQNNAVWMLALLASGVVSAAERDRALAYLDRVKDNGHLSDKTTNHQLRMLLKLGRQAAGDDAVSFATPIPDNAMPRGATLIKKFTKDYPSAKYFFEGMMRNRNLRQPAAVRPLLPLRTRTFCGEDRKRVLALILAVCPYPWMREEKGDDLRLPIELVEFIAYILADMHVGTFLESGEEIQTTFMNGDVY